MRSAYIEILRTRAQVAATEASRALQEEKVRVESEKFRIGKSTSLLVAQAQRDLLASQIAYVQAVAGYRKALVELYRLEGTLLQRRGLAAPGSAPPQNRAGSVDCTVEGHALSRFCCADAECEIRN